MALMLIAFFLPFSYMEYYQEIKPGFTGSDLLIYSGIGLALMIVWFSSFYGWFAVTAKRFHDFDTTGWAQIIPIYGNLAPMFA